MRSGSMIRRLSHIHLLWRRNLARHSLAMPVDHYENFPVASLLLPRRLRPAVEAIYAFARSADDLADEGDATPAQRLAALAAYEEELDRIATGTRPNTALFQRLAGFLRLSPDERWTRDAVRCFVVRKGHEHDASLRQWYGRRVQQVFAADLEFAEKLARFAA